MGHKREPGELGNNFEKLARTICKTESERKRLRECLVEGNCASPALIWRKSRPETSPFEVHQPLTWQPNFIDRLLENQRAGKHELHEAGAYYCLDFSSVLEISAVLAIKKPIARIIDVCSSPGGKAAFLASLFSPEEFICNETIGKRLGPLVANIRRCGINAQVTNADAAVLSQHWKSAFDLVVVDAPCSGQSLLAKGEQAQACFHPVTLNKNANRQRRLIASAGEVVCKDGYLAFMTCTYSLDENEETVAWFLKKNPDGCFTPVLKIKNTKLPHLAGVFTCSFLRRLYLQIRAQEGFFKMDSSQGPNAP